MVNEFELALDEQVKRLRKRYPYPFIEVILFDWIRDGKSYFADSKDSKRFFQDEIHRTSFIGMLLTHVVKLDNYYKRYPEKKTQEADEEVLHIVLFNGMKTRAYRPNMARTEEEVLQYLIEDGVEEAIGLVQSDDYVLQNLVKSLVQNRYEARRKKALDFPKVAIYDATEDKITSTALFFAINIDTTEREYDLQQIKEKHYYM